MANLEYRRWSWVDSWSNPTGSTRAERTPCRYRAYIPEQLLDLDLAIPAVMAADLADVEQQVRQLRGNQPGLPDLEPLARFLLRAEAVASSNIEGLTINVRRLARSEAAQAQGLPVTDATARAVLGNMRAVELAVELAAESRRRFGIDDLRKLHAALLRGTRDEHWAGVIRTEQNWVGGLNPCSAAYVPPPEDEVGDLLADLCDYLSGDDYPALLQAAVAHSQFETIHPFADGNGRTGRALIQLVLRRRGITATALPPISLVLATVADRYVGALDGTRTQGDPQRGLLEWVELFLASTSRACHDAGRFAIELGELEAATREKAGPVRANSTLDLLISALPSLPVFSVTTAADHLGRSYQASGDAVERLRAAGIVRQVSIGSRNRAFEATAVLDALTGFERSLASPDADTAITSPTRPVPARR